MYSEHDYDEDSDFVVGTARYIPKGGESKGGEIISRTLCVKRKEQKNVLVYFIIYNSKAKIGAGDLGPVTVVPSGVLRERDLERFKRIATGTEVPQIPGMDYPDPLTVFKAWIAHVLKKAEQNDCYRSYRKEVKD